MDLERALLEEHSKKQTHLIAQYIGSDKKRFKALMNLFFYAEPIIIQRAAWVMSYCYEAHPELIKPYLEPLLKNLVKPGLHDAVKRNTLKVLQSISVPDKLLGSLVDLCFGFLYSAGEAIAVKSLSINILVKTCTQYPELQVELNPILNVLLDHDSPAIQYTSKHGLAVLKKTKK